MTADLPAPTGDQLKDLVSRFYGLIHQDQRIRHFFDTTQSASLTRKQIWFFSTLLMGDSDGTAAYIREAHKGLVLKNGLKDAHFDAIIECLNAAMADSDLPQDLQDQMLESAEDLRDAVLYR